MKTIKTTLLITIILAFGYALLSLVIYGLATYSYIYDNQGISSTEFISSLVLGIFSIIIYITGGIYFLKFRSFTEEKTISKAPLILIFSILFVLINWLISIPAFITYFNITRLKNGK